MHRLVGGQRERRAAQLGRVQPQQEVVHDRVAHHGQRQHVVRILAGLRAEIGDQLVDARPDDARQLGLGARGSSSRRRPGSSGPRRSGSAGSWRRRTPAPRRWPGRRDDPATVVEPTSNATPSMRSWNPGQIAVMVRPSCTATVAVQSPARSVRCSDARTWASHRVETGEVPVRLQRLEQPLQVAAGIGHVGLADLDVVQAHDGSTSMACASASLRTTWRCSWLSGGTSTTRSSSTRA